MIKCQGYSFDCRDGFVDPEAMISICIERACDDLGAVGFCFHTGTMSYNA